MLISGGQTGVDRAALDFAMQSGIPCHGWCPAGRRAEDGAIPDFYRLLETDSALYQQRTRLNVRDSDATLIFTDGCPSRGTALTVECCRRMKKPFLLIDVADELQKNRLNDLSETTQSGEEWLSEKPPVSETAFSAAGKIKTWLQRTKPAVLNLAGPRASECPTIADLVVILLRQTLCPSTTPAPEWPPRRPFTPDLIQNDI
ncbi:MAG: putative molybdenum carrier protein [Candidatus Riflebacteria bacterium]|nr:putative molybdenum carrier protein [Candidatus Riflebacteria bacterium]